MVNSSWDPRDVAAFVQATKERDNSWRSIDPFDSEVYLSVGQLLPDSDYCCVTFTRDGQVYGTRASLSDSGKRIKEWLPSNDVQAWLDWLTFDNATAEKDSS